MKSIVAALGLLALAATSVVTDQAQEPFAVYKTYLDTFAKSDTLDPLLKFYTKELASGLARMPKDQQANYMKMQAGKQKLSEIKVTKQNVDASKAVFEMTARTADGRTISGSATLTKEGNDWKVDDEAWVLPPPKD